MSNDNELYTARELADILGVAAQTIRNRMKIGRLQSEKIGTGVFISRQNIEKWLSLPKALNSRRRSADKEWLEQQRKILGIKGGQSNV